MALVVFVGSWWLRRAHCVIMLCLTFPQVYDVDLAEVIPKVLRLLFQRNNTTTNIHAYVTTTIRNPATFNVFLTSLQTQQLIYEELNITPQNSSFVYNRSSVVLFRIHL